MLTGSVSDRSLIILMSVTNADLLTHLVALMLPRPKASEKQ
jgi:hypothetical protein